MGVRSPGGLLICGPARSGKSALAALLGRLLAGHPDCQAHIIHISCRDVETDTLAHARDQLTPLVGLRSVLAAKAILMARGDVVLFAGMLMKGQNCRQRTQFQSNRQKNTLKGQTASPIGRSF